MPKFPINSVVSHRDSEFQYRIIDFDETDYELLQVKPTLETITFTYPISELEELCYLKSAIRRH